MGGTNDSAITVKRSRWSLRAKLIVSFLVIAVMIGITSLFQLIGTRQIDTVFQDLSRDDLQRLLLVKSIDLDMLDLHHALISEQTADSTKRLTGQEQEILLQQTRSNVRRQTAEYRSHIAPEDGVKIKPAADAITATTDRVFINSEALVAVRTSHGNAAAISAAEDALAHSQAALEETIDETATFESQQIADEDSQVNRIVHRNTVMAMGIAIVTVLIALLVGAVLSRFLLKTLSQLKSGAALVAAGDFSYRLDVSSKDEFGQLAAAFNQMTTRLRNSYQRLAIQSERDETLIESLGEGLIGIDEHASIVLINPQAIAMLGIDNVNSFIGKPVTKAFVMYGKDDQPLPEKEWPGVVAIASGKSIADVYGYRTKENGRVQLGVTASPIMVQNKPAGAILVIRDVTKEREVDRMKTEFISLASHQLRTPLSAIKWFSELLLAGDAGKMNPEQVDFTKNISDSTERMIQLVNSLLNISRIESGRIIVDPQPTDLKELVSGIVNDLKAKIEERQQALVISVHPDMPKINLDPRLIGQVYMNILTNAIKYTPVKGEISVFISKRGDDVLSQITDNGYGIPKQQQDRIFQKFFRAENAVKVETVGTGLGLYLIKAIVESSVGKIWFESKEDKGTTFWFTLPLSGMKAQKGEVTLEIAATKRPHQENK
ncbi:MAG: ATP-binding protein [Candidatus Saccharimonadales bacterium]